MSDDDSRLDSGFDPVKGADNMVSICNIPFAVGWMVIKVSFVVVKVAIGLISLFAAMAKKDKEE